MKLIILTTALVLSAAGAMSQHAHNSQLITETGQAQFAAIAEIVAHLRDDPNTDWEQVNIDALRDHLVDMDNVTRKTKVTRSIDGLVVKFTVTGNSVVAISVQRMVNAHSSMLQQASEWKVSVEQVAGGAIMQIETLDESDLVQVLGLGFFGLLTVGAHHQQHHLMIATGRSPH
jgi:hypothetical protein